MLHKESASPERGEGFLYLLPAGDGCCRCCGSGHCHCWPGHAAMLSSLQWSNQSVTGQQGDPKRQEGKQSTPPTRQPNAGRDNPSSGRGFHCSHEGAQLWAQSQATCPGLVVVSVGIHATAE